jgi:chemotaxis family two-component system response regulator Rcp1
MDQLITRSGLPVRIMMVEDNEGDVLLTREALKDAEIVNELFQFKDGEAAIRFLREAVAAGFPQLPGLILMDINMPKLSGHEVMFAMRQDPVLSEIPVFLFTSSEAPPDIERSKHNRATGYLVKPLDLQKFREAVLSTPGLAFTEKHD